MACDGISFAVNEDSMHWVLSRYCLSGPPLSCGGPGIGPRGAHGGACSACDCCAAAVVGASPVPTMPNKNVSAAAPTLAVRRVATRLPILATANPERELTRRISALLRVPVNFAGTSYAAAKVRADRQFNSVEPTDRT